MNPILVLILRLILILLSYTFVGWIAYAVFTDLRQRTAAGAPTSVPPLTLTATLEETTQSRQFQSSEIKIGRDPASDFTLNHETISLSHCRLSYHHNQWWAEDLDSTNGSYLNNTQIDSPVVLTEGDELRLGQIYVTIQFN